MLSLVYYIILRYIEIFKHIRFRLSLLLYPFYTIRVSLKLKNSTIWLKIHIES